VTFDEYDRFCEETGTSKPDDAGWGRGRRPAINVSWWDAIAFCNWVSDEEGLPRAYDDAGNFIDRNGAITMAPSEVWVIACQQKQNGNMPPEEELTVHHSGIPEAILWRKWHGMVGTLLRRLMKSGRSFQMLLEYMI